MRKWQVVNDVTTEGLSTTILPTDLITNQAILSIEYNTPEEAESQLILLCNKNGKLNKFRTPFNLTLSEYVSIAYQN